MLANIISSNKLNGFFNKYILFAQGMIDLNTDLR